jgi:tetratricopeptide (TPR) repeat protein
MFYIGTNQDQTLTQDLQIQDYLNLNVSHEDQGKIGNLLHQAGLISHQEVILALEEQKIKRDLKLGQILATKGFVKQQTADFFATRWHSMIVEVKIGDVKYKLGECLEQAGLLNPIQVNQILELQKITNQRFGQIAIEQGYLKQETLKLFVENLCIYNYKYLNELVGKILISAQKLIKIKEYALAIIELRKALKYNPHHAGIHALLSIIYIKEQHLTMAHIHLKKAQRSNPDEPLLIEAKMLLEIQQTLTKQKEKNLRQKQESAKKSGLVSFFTKKLAIA